MSAARQRSTQTLDTVETLHGQASNPRLIRFFRADDPFDATETFLLEGSEPWAIGRIDGEPPAPGTSRCIWSQRDATMSSQHAVLERAADGWTIADAGSKNGTFWNATRLLEPALLRDGHIVECGRTFFLYRDRAGSGTASFVPRCAPLDLPPLHYQIAPLFPFVASDVSLHLQGETGSGKEIVARAVHEMSGRRGAFVARNCAAIPENLFEAELFGYTKGAFSGASSDQPGQIVAAHGGTLFLDEIGELSLPLQAKLLRVLELKEVLPLGARNPLHVDFRLVSATLCDLQAKVQAGLFRNDLHGRLGRTFVVPPLREHKEELGRMIQVFLAAQLTARLDGSKATPIPYFTPAASRAVVHHNWPYNVRELKQCVESAFISALANAEEGMCEIDLRHLPPLVRGGRACIAPAREAGEERERVLADVEILNALQQAHGNRAQAARLLGVTERTIFRRLRKLRDAKT